MFKKSIVFLTVLLCFLVVQPVYAATIVSYDLDGLDVGSFEFKITAPYAVADFTASLPSGWTDGSNGSTFATFDLSGTNSLTSGDMGSFVANDVVLYDWVIGNQSAVELTQGSNYWVHEVPGGYLVSASATVPIPGAIWLLGSALIGLLGIKRKFP